MFARQVTAKDNSEAFIWKDPLMIRVIKEAGKDPEYMEVAALVKENWDKSHVKNKLRTGHPAGQWIRVWDRLGYEPDPASGTILMILDAAKVCISQGTNAEGIVDGSLRKRISSWLHIPHLGKLKTSRPDRSTGHRSEVVQKSRD